MSEPVRTVLFLIPSLRGGGAERVIVTLLRHLDRQRFRPTLAVVDMRDAVYLDDLPQDMELIDLESTRVRNALPGIIRLIWRRRPDVVLSTLGHLNLALAIVRPLLPSSIRYLARESCVVSEVICGYRRPALWRWAYRYFYRRFDAVICQSQDMRDDLVDTLALPRAKALVIHNPVDTERIRRLAIEPVHTGLGPAPEAQAGSDIHLVGVGRLVAQKGFDILIEALALTEDPRFRLTLVGEGPLRHELAALAKSLGIEDRVRFAGFQRNPYPFIAQAAALVLSSRYEGLPNVVLEAFACGTPVIALPALGGVHELLFSTAGCMVALDASASALSSALRAFTYSKRLEGNVAEPYLVNRVLQQYEGALSISTSNPKD